MRLRLLTAIALAGAVLWWLRPEPCVPPPPVPCPAPPVDAGATDDLTLQLDACARALLRCETAERLRVRNNAP